MSRNGGSSNNRPAARAARWAALVAAGVAAIGAVPFAVAQDNGGLTARLRVSETLRYDSNPAFSAAGSEARFFSRTDLSFGLSSVTRSSAIALNAGVWLVLPEDPNTASVLNEPFATLTYSRESRSARFDALVSYRSRGIAGFQIVDDEIDDTDDLIVDTGSRNDLTMQAGLAVGIDAPLGFQLDLSRRDLSYEDVTDPDLVDRQDDRVAALATFRIDPRITARLSASRSVTRIEDAFDTRRTRDALGVGVDLAVSPILNANVTLNFNRNETATTLGTTETDGVGYALEVTRAMADGGVLAASLSSSVTINGRRSTGSVSRSFTMKGGRLSVSAGGSQMDNSELNPLFSLDYSHELKRGSVSIRLAQEADGDRNDDEVIRSRLSVAYDQALTSRAGFSLGVGYTDLNAIDPTGIDLSRLDLSLKYRHDVGRDWDLVAGYEYRLSRQEGAGDRSGNSLFLGLEKTFDFRP